MTGFLAFFCNQNHTIITIKDAKLMSQSFTSMDAGTQYPIPIYSTEEDNDEYDLSELTKSNILVDFTEDQFNNLYRFVNVNRHRNKYLLEILNVLKRSKPKDTPVYPEPEGDPSY